MSDTTPGRGTPEPDDVRVTCFGCGELRPVADFREADLDGDCGEPWCASCRETAEELARDEEAGR